MQLAHLDGVDLEYDAVGSGEPLLLIHGGLIAANSFVPLVAESSLASRSQIISYNRRGYAGSSRPTPPFSIAQQAADARALLGHLGISRAHVVGHSYGGAIAIRVGCGCDPCFRVVRVLVEGCGSFESRRHARTSGQDKSQRLANGSLCAGGLRPATTRTVE